MTDFFADLEQELRGAHGRRPRPVVPVRGIAVTAAVAATLAAFVLALGSVVGSGEQDVAAPKPVEDGWTAYAPLDCSGRVVDGMIPDEIVDRFAILRGDVEPANLSDGEVPAGLADIVRQSLRPLHRDDDRKYLVGVGHLADDQCSPGVVVVCLISLQSAEDACAAPGDEPFLQWLVEDADDRLIAVLGGDEVKRARVRQGRTSAVLGLQGGNVGFVELSEADEGEVTVEDATP